MTGHWVVKKGDKYLSVKINYNTHSVEEDYSSNIEAAACFTHRHEEHSVAKRVKGEVISRSEEIVKEQ